MILIPPDSMTRNRQDFDELLRQSLRGDEAARHRLLALLYDELHRLAARLMHGQPPGHTLQPTALVSEAYIRLMGGRDPEIHDRTHFLAQAARAMRSVLVDHARRKRSKKRRVPDQQGDPLDAIVTRFESRALDLIALDEALLKLKERDEPMVRAIELRFFGGLSVDEAAAILDMPKRSLERQWTAARAWLLRELSD